MTRTSTPARAENHGYSRTEQQAQSSSKNQTTPHQTGGGQETPRQTRDGDRPPIPRYLVNVRAGSMVVLAHRHHVLRAPVDALLRLANLAEPKDERVGEGGKKEPEPAKASESHRRQQTGLGRRTPRKRPQASPPSERSTGEQHFITSPSTRDIHH